MACGTFLDQGANPQPLRWQAGSLPRVTWGTQDELQIQAEKKKESLASWSHHCTPSISICSCLEPAVGLFGLLFTAPSGLKTP